MSGVPQRSTADVSTISSQTTEVASWPESDFRYYGWRVVFAACFGVMAGFGSLFVYTFSVFVKPPASEFGWTREAISGGFAIAAVTLGVVSPALGQLIDRLGPRRIILPCMTIYACGFISLAFFAFRRLAVLRDLFSAQRRRQWRGSSRLLTIHLHLVPSAHGNCSRIRDG